MKGSRHLLVAKECCGTCIHYRQHYVLSTLGSFHPLWFGHCGTPRMKSRDPDEVCPHWAPVVPPSEPEESKETI